MLCASVDLCTCTWHACKKACWAFSACPMRVLRRVFGIIPCRIHYWEVPVTAVTAAVLTRCAKFRGFIEHQRERSRSKRRTDKNPRQRRKQRGELPRFDAGCFDAKCTSLTIGTLSSCTQNPQPTSPLLLSPQFVMKLCPFNSYLLWPQEKYTK